MRTAGSGTFNAGMGKKPGEQARKFVDIYLPLIQATACSILSRRYGLWGAWLKEGIEEVSQETWLELEKLAQKWSSGTWQRDWSKSFGAYLRTITVRTCAHWIRRRRGIATEDITDRDLPVLDDEFEKVWQRAEAESVLQIMNLFPRSFSIMRRSCLRLYYLEGKTVREVAKELGASEVAVRKHLRTGLSTLKRLILRRNHASLPTRRR